VGPNDEAEYHTLDRQRTTLDIDDDVPLSLRKIGPFCLYERKKNRVTAKTGEEMEFKLLWVY
jgi:hypothetical protein